DASPSRRTARRRSASAAPAWGRSTRPSRQRSAYRSSTASPAPSSSSRASSTTGSRRAASPPSGSRRKRSTSRGRTALRRSPSAASVRERVQRAREHTDRRSGVLDGGELGGGVTPAVLAAREDHCHPGLLRDVLRIVVRAAVHAAEGDALVLRRALQCLDDLRVAEAGW